MGLLLNFPWRFSRSERHLTRVTGGIYEYLSSVIKPRILTGRNISDRKLIRKIYLTFAPLSQIPRSFVRSCGFIQRDLNIGIKI